MDKLFYKTKNTEIENNSEDNLFVKNIIVNKERKKIRDLPYIATERWVEQLGHRLEINC